MNGIGWEPHGKVQDANIKDHARFFAHHGRAMNWQLEEDE